MTDDEKIEQMVILMGRPCEGDVFDACLEMAKRKILNRRFPYGTTLKDVEEIYDQLHIELAICIYNKRGADGESSHSENGVSRVYRSENEILQEIVPYAGVPNL